PSARKIRHVSSSVATVIPEIGFELDPISPVSRDDTVTNRNPNTTIKIAATNVRCSDGVSVSAATRARLPSATKPISRSPPPRPPRAPAAPRPQRARRARGPPLPPPLPPPPPPPPPPAGPTHPPGHASRPPAPPL